MKKRSFALFLTVCFLMLMCFSAFAANQTVDLEVGKTYSATILHTIASEEDLDIVGYSDAQNGISLNCVKAEDGRAITISYSGTPAAAGNNEFTVSYLDAGVEKSYTVKFNVTGASTPPEPVIETAEKPVITGKSPENSKLTMKQTDKPQTFSVNAAGNGTLSYKWILDGKEVATGASYEFIPFSLQVGEYALQCIVKNTVDIYSVESGNDSPTWTITVTEGEAPKITNKSSAAQIDGTGDINFTVEAEGENLTYQWYLVKSYEKDAIKDGKYGQIEYSGANTKTLKVMCTNAPTTVTSKFVCEVSSAAGITAQTDEYTLYITEDPNLTKVKEINVAKKPEKTEYVVGETLETAGLEIEVVTGKDKQNITNGFVCTPLLLENEGVQQITVSYGGKTTVFNVTVEKASHEHKWSEWEKDEDGGIVTRKCTVEKCDAKEMYSFADFIKIHPIEASELGIKIKEEPETEDTKPQEDEKPVKDDTDAADKEILQHEKEPKSDKKQKGNGIFWVIIVIALILLAGALYVYFKLFKTPYKKPAGKGHNGTRQQPSKKNTSVRLFSQKK